MKVEDLKSLSNKVTEWEAKKKAEHYFRQFLNALQPVLLGNRQQPVTQQKEQLFGALGSFNWETSSRPSESYNNQWTSFVYFPPRLPMPIKTVNKPKLNENKLDLTFQRQFLINFGKNHQY